MNLRSTKVASKSPKHSSFDDDDDDNKIVTKQVEKEVFFSKLPDDLLTKIISHIPDARDAKRTCILSTRWNYICASILYFVMPFVRYNEKENEFFYEFNTSSSKKEQVKKFNDSVDKALALRCGMPIQKFFLCLSTDYDYTRVLNWLRTVNRCPVQQLELRLAACYYDIIFYWNILEKFNTLIELTLNGNFLLHVRECDGVLFPSLKKLNLISVVYFSEHTLMNLIFHCPVLEELSMKKQFYKKKNYHERFKVSSMSLKRLSLSLIDFNSDVTVHNVFIEAPNLEYIHILDEVTSEYHMTAPLSLVEAHVDVSRRNFELFTSLSSVKILTLTCQTIRAFNTIDGLTWATPLFPNLVKLLIGINGASDWDFLLVLLNHMPNLEHITFTNGLVCIDQIYNPKCNLPTPRATHLLSNVKEIVLLNLDAVFWEEFSFIRYLLNNAKKLETFTISGPKICPKKRQEILKYSRGSKFCRVEFV